MQIDPAPLQANVAVKARRGFRRGELLLIIAAGLLAAVLVLNVIALAFQDQSSFWHSVAFDNISAISTALAAGVAIVGLWFQRRSGGSDSGGTGLSNNEADLMRELIDRRAHDQMSAEDLRLYLETLAEIRRASGPGPDPEERESKPHSNPTPSEAIAMPEQAWPLALQAQISRALQELEAPDGKIQRASETTEPGADEPSPAPNSGMAACHGLSLLTCCG